MTVHCSVHCYNIHVFCLHFARTEVSVEYQILLCNINNKMEGEPSKWKLKLFHNQITHPWITAFTLCWLVIKWQKYRFWSKLSICIFDPRFVFHIQSFILLKESLWRKQPVTFKHWRWDWIYLFKSNNESILVNLTY